MKQAAIWIGLALLAALILIAALVLLRSTTSSTSTPTSKATLPVTIANSSGDCPNATVRYVVDDSLANGRLLCVNLNSDPYIQGYRAYYDAPNQNAGRGGSAGCNSPYQQAISDGTRRLCILEGLVIQHQ